MKIRLLDYNGKETFTEIPDNTQEIALLILSGDMVMVYPKFEDSSNCRVEHFFDGHYIIKKKDFHILDEIKDSYGLEEFEEINNKK